MHHKDLWLRRNRDRADAFQVNRRINSINRYRSDYYKYHTGKKWKNPENYDLCLRTDVLGYQGCVDLICDYIERRLGITLQRKKL